MLCFDLTRRRDNMIKSTIQTKRKEWAKIKRLLESLTPDQLLKAAEQARCHEPITDKAVNELLKMVGRVGSSAPGSSSKKWYMFSQLKSSTIYHGSPVIFLTLNPGERDAPITLKFAGKKINVREFYPEWYSQTERLRTTLHNPLAVVDYFHQTVNAIIEKVLKGGLFGELAHFYGVIEYQGHGTPHAHILVNSVLILMLISIFSCGSRGPPLPSNYESEVDRIQPSANGFWILSPPSPVNVCLPKSSPTPITFPNHISSDHSSDLMILTLNIIWRLTCTILSHGVRYTVKPTTHHASSTIRRSVE